MLNASLAPIRDWLAAELRTWLPMRRPPVAVWDGAALAFEVPLRRSLWNRPAIVLRATAEGIALRRQFPLPEAGRMHLRKLAANQIERRTPWRAGDVYFDATPVPGAGDKGTFLVELTVVPRMAVRQAIEAVRAAGSDPLWLEIGEGTRLPIIDDGAVPQGGRRRGLVVLALMVLLLASPFARLAWLDREVAARAIEVADTRRLADRIEAVQAAAGLAEQRKAEAVSAVVVVEVLSRLLPDDVWLDELQLDGGTLLIGGRAADASRLPALLSGSPYFADVIFRSALLREGNADRFRIAAHVVPHDFP